MSKGRDKRSAIKHTYREAFRHGGSVTCGICGKPIRYYSDLTIDHILPKSKGGDNHYTNLAPAHYQCNQAKKDQVIPELVYEQELTK